jgi:hypothetical protein
MGQRNERRTEIGAALKIDVPSGLVCRWPPKREYAPTHASAVAAMMACLPRAVPVR